MDGLAVVVGEAAPGDTDEAGAGDDDDDDDACDWVVGEVEASDTVEGALSLAEG